MKVGKWLKWLAGGALLTVVVIAAVAYLLISWVPADYKPTRLSHNQKTLVAGDEFVPHILAFGNSAQKNRPYTWSITQEQLNAYLASVDQITDFLTPGPNKAGRVYETMAGVGLVEPATTLHDGVLTLMVRQCEYNKVLSVDVSIRLTAAKLLRVRLEQLRIGRLRVPEFFLRGRIRSFRDMMLAQMPDGDTKVVPRLKGRTLVGVSSNDLGELLSVLVRAVDEAPIRPRLTWPIGKKSVQVDRIEIDEGLLTLHLVPAGD